MTKAWTTSTMVLVSNLKLRQSDICVKQNEDFLFSPLRFSSFPNFNSNGTSCPNLRGSHVI